MRFVLSALLALGACGPLPDPTAACGPNQATVLEVIDGDSIRLSDGNWVRYLLVDAPEMGHSPECFAAEADAYNRSLVAAKTIELTYDTPCRDEYGRLLAYVSVNGLDVNQQLLRRGYACRLYIPPAGSAMAASYADLESQAKEERAGLWGACKKRPC